jgi:hypothetical protein
MTLGGPHPGTMEAVPVQFIQFEANQDARRVYDATSSPAPPSLTHASS